MLSLIDNKQLTAICCLGIFLFSFCYQGSFDVVTLRVIRLFEQASRSIQKHLACCLHARLHDALPVAYVATLREFTAYWGTIAIIRRIDTSYLLWILGCVGMYSLTMTLHLHIKYKFLPADRTLDFSLSGMNPLVSLD